MTKKPFTIENADDFESLLRRFQPKSSVKSEADVLYQCGWEAAMQSVTTQAEQRLGAPHMVGARIRTSHTSFACGLVAGIAAAVLMMVSLRLPDFVERPMADASRSVVETPRGQEVQDVTERLLVDEDDELFNPRLPNANRLSSLAGLEFDIGSIADSRRLGLPVRSTQALSVVARNNWASTLETPTNSGFQADVDQAVNFRPPPSRTLGEMLSELATEGYF